MIRWGGWGAPSSPRGDRPQQRSTPAALFMTHVAFVQAITENPEDDSPRLVYADWLDEHGQPERAEFIRVQCQLARVATGDPRRSRLEAREQELLSGHVEEWARPLPRAVRALATSSRLTRLTTLHLSACGIDDEACRVVAAAPWASLHVLDLSSNAVGDGGVEALLTAPHVSRLGVLDLRRNPISDWVKRRLLEQLGNRVLI